MIAEEKFLLFRYFTEYLCNTIFKGRKIKAFSETEFGKFSASVRWICFHYFHFKLHNNLWERGLRGVWLEERLWNRSRNSKGRQEAGESQMVATMSSSSEKTLAFLEGRNSCKVKCLPWRSFASILQCLYPFAIATKMLCSKLKKLLKCFDSLHKLICFPLDSL